MDQLFFGINDRKITIPMLYKVFSDNCLKTYFALLANRFKLNGFLGYGSSSNYRFFGCQYQKIAIKDVPILGQARSSGENLAYSSISMSCYRNIGCQSFKPEEDLIGMSVFSQISRAVQQTLSSVKIILNFFLLKIFVSNKKC